MTAAARAHTHIHLAARVSATGTSAVRCPGVLSQLAKAAVAASYSGSSSAAAATAASRNTFAAWAERVRQDPPTAAQRVSAGHEGEVACVLWRGVAVECDLCTTICLLLVAFTSSRCGMPAAHGLYRCWTASSRWPRIWRPCRQHRQRAWRPPSPLRGGSSSCRRRPQRAAAPAPAAAAPAPAAAAPATSSLTCLC
jgi:hypothetical protein